MKKERQTKMANEIPQTPLTTPPPFYYPEIPQKPKKGLAKVIFGVILIILFGAGISLAARIWDPLWNPFRPVPEKVIEKMAQEMKEVKMLHSEIKIDFEAKEDAKESFKMTLNFKGDSDTTDKENLKSSGNFEIIMTSGGTEISLAGDTRVIGEDSYFKLTKFPNIPLPGVNVGQIISQIKDRWIKYNKESYLKYFLGEIPPAMTKEIQESQEKQEETTKKLGSLFKDKKLYIVKKEFPDDKIRNVGTYHYLIALNKEEIKKLILELLKITQEVRLPAQSLQQSAFAEISPEIDKFFEKIDEITADIYIGKKDNYLYEIKGGKEIDMSKFKEGAKGAMIIKAEMDFSNFNKPVKIEPPKDFKNLEEMFKEILQRYLLPK